MAPVKLKCTTGDSCNYETQQLEFEQANILLESHLKHSHPVQVGGNDGRKLPQFPRPELKLDSSAEEWSEFIVTWNQFKEEYNLEGPSLIRYVSFLHVARKTFVIVYQELRAAVTLLKPRLSC